jgi:Fe2+ transport system protein FeoA
LRDRGYYPKLPSVKQKPTHQCEILEGCCAGAEVCPLTQIKAGTRVAIKHLAVTPEMGNRLREMGFCEDQQIKLIARNSSFICQVCNARLGISKKLAEAIMVQAVSEPLAQ